MLRELVSNNIFVFTSDRYAQVTAGLVVTSQGAVLIDTLAFPSETRQVMRYVQERHKVPIRYVINTHYHADHTYGTGEVEGATVVSHHLTRELLDTAGRAALEDARKSSREFASVSIRLPDVVMHEGDLRLHIGGLTLRLMHAPGHSLDSIVVLVEEEEVLFAADLMMSVPFFGDGSWEDYVNSLTRIREGHYESIVQGHGELILRGETESRIDEDLAYLHCLRQGVEKVIQAGGGPEQLAEIDVADCGKNPIGLNGIVQQLHLSNARTLYQQLTGT